MTVAYPSSSRPHCAGRWLVRVVLAVAVLAQLLACQAVLAPVVGTSTAAVQDVGHAIGHDVLCEVGTSTLATTGHRGLSPDGRPAGVPGFLDVALTTTGLSSGDVATAGGPPWAPRNAVAGRLWLFGVGISRV